jgi:hypothetical protein
MLDILKINLRRRRSPKAIIAYNENRQATVKTMVRKDLNIG